MSPEKVLTGGCQDPALMAVRTAGPAGALGGVWGSVQSCRGRGVVPPGPRACPREAFVPSPARGRER